MSELRTNINRDLLHTVCFTTRARGFFRHLIDCKKLNFKIVMLGNLYTTDSKLRLLLAKLVRSRLFDVLGIMQRIKCVDAKCDAYGSFCRFLKTDKPYFIFLDTPVALYHYCLGRRNSFLGKKRLRKYLDDSNLAAIVCRSEACRSTFETLNGRYDGLLTKICSYVPSNSIVTHELISHRCERDEMKLLYISQGIRFTSKGGLEILEAFSALRKKYGSNISLTIVTSIANIRKLSLDTEYDTAGVMFHDFIFTYPQLEKLYAESSLLLHPTSDDSIGMVVLESIKAGLPVISTRLYAIPEMVADGVNGFLTDPKHWFYDENNIPNPTVWNNRKKTIYSMDTSNALVEFIYEKVCVLNDDRELLKKMSLESLRIAKSPPFDEDTIVSAWNEVIHSISR